MRTQVPVALTSQNERGTQRMVNKQTDPLRWDFWCSCYTSSLLESIQAKSPASYLTIVAHKTYFVTFNFSLTNRKPLWVCKPVFHSRFTTSFSHVTPWPGPSDSRPPSHWSSDVHFTKVLQSFSRHLFISGAPLINEWQLMLSSFHFSHFRGIQS